MNYYTLGYFLLFFPYNIDWKVTVFSEYYINKVFPAHPIEINITNFDITTYPNWASLGNKREKLFRFDGIYKYLLLP